MTYCIVMKLEEVLGQAGWRTLEIRRLVYLRKYWLNNYVSDKARQGWGSFNRVRESEKNYSARAKKVVSTMYSLTDRFVSLVGPHCYLQMRWMGRVFLRKAGGEKKEEWSCNTVVEGEWCSSEDKRHSRGKEEEWDRLVIMQLLWMTLGNSLEAQGQGPTRCDSQALGRRLNPKQRLQRGDYSRSFR